MREIYGFQSGLMQTLAFKAYQSLHFFEETMQ